MTRRLTREQLAKIHAMNLRKKEIVKEFSSQRDEPFTVKQTKTISQADLIRMQRDAGVRG